MLNNSFINMIKCIKENGPCKCITCVSSFEPCTSQHQLPPRSRFDILPSQLPPPCCLVTSCAASGSGNSWMSSRSHLPVTSSISTFISVCHPALITLSSPTPAPIQAILFSIHFPKLCHISQLCSPSVLPATHF